MKIPAEPERKVVVPADIDRLRIVFKKICVFCAQYSHSPQAVTANSKAGRHAAELLQRFSTALGRTLPELVDPSFRISVAKARPSLPRVPWVAISREGSSVSGALSVAVCFGRNGDGAVVGLMYPAVGVVHKVPRQKRTGSSEPYIDVDGNNPNTMYNDRFVNPLEFRPSDFDAEQFLRHLRESLQLLRDFTRKPVSI